MRASIQCDIVLADVLVPADAILPGAAGLRGPFSCLNEARYGIIWGAMGAARDAYEAALAYALGRRQFGKPIASFQLTQEKLVDMVLEIQKGPLVALHIGRMKDAGTLVPEQISFGKLNNVRTAIAIARQARTILGGNGVALEYSPMRHALLPGYVRELVFDLSGELSCGPAEHGEVPQQGVTALTVLLPPGRQ